MNMKTVSILNWFAVICFSAVGSASNQKCVPRPITVRQCKNKFYNFTTLPNVLGLDQQSEIQIRIDSFYLLLPKDCSKDLNFLLCSIYVPFCDFDTKIHLKPCRSVCEKVLMECGSFLVMSNFSWPENFNCSQFPLNSGDDLECMERGKHNKITTQLVIPKRPTYVNPFSYPKELPLYNGQCRHLRFGERYIFINRTGRCALKCSNNDLFSDESKFVANIWLTIIASLTFASTLFTCLTFCHSSRIHYPEQPIIFLTFSYNIYSISLLVRLFLGRSKVSCDYDPVSGQRILIQEGLENTYCAITFLLNFFFSTATHMWWVMLTLCWTLYCSMNVMAGSLAKNSGIFHLFVWLMTSVLTVSVLILRSVDADELFGICSVGQQSPDLLLTFSIIPKAVCLLTGFVFLISGFVCFGYRTKYFNKNEIISQQKATYVLSTGFRLGLFSIIYVIAIFTLISCEMYQYYNYNSWLKAPRVFKKRKEPLVAIFLLKIFMSQVVGINSAIWIWSLDAAGSWRKLFSTIKYKMCDGSKTPSASPDPIDELLKTPDSGNKDKYCLYYKSDH